MSGSDVAASGQRLLDTPDLLDQIRNGDSDAYNELFDRYTAQLEAFVGARLPGNRKTADDVAELVEEVSIRILPFVGRIEYRGIGSFWARLRETALVCVDEAWQDPPRNQDRSESGLLDRTQFIPFERALNDMPEQSRNAFLMRLELGLDYQSISEECAFASADAARQDISQTIENLGRELADSVA